MPNFEQKTVGGWAGPLIPRTFRQTYNNACGAAALLLAATELRGHIQIAHHANFGPQNLAGWWHVPHNAGNPKELGLSADWLKVIYRWTCQHTTNVAVINSNQLNRYGTNYPSAIAGCALHMGFNVEVKAYRTKAVGVFKTLRRREYNRLQNLAHANYNFTEDRATRSNHVLNNGEIELKLLTSKMRFVTLHWVMVRAGAVVQPEAFDPATGYEYNTVQDMKTDFRRRALQPGHGTGLSIILS